MAYHAEVLLDSVNPAGQRLTTFVLRFPRFVLPEFNTHRMFSRNASSSSRGIRPSTVGPAILYSFRCRIGSTAPSWTGTARP